MLPFSNHYFAFESERCGPSCCDSAITTSCHIEQHQGPSTRKLWICIQKMVGPVGTGAADERRYDRMCPCLTWQVLTNEVPTLHSSAEALTLIKFSSSSLKSEFNTTWGVIPSENLPLFHWASVPQLAPKGLGKLAGNNACVTINQLLWVLHRPGMSNLDRELYYIPPNWQKRADCIVVPIYS